MSNGNYNKSAIYLKSLVDNAREEQEALKFAFYSIDNSEGAQIMMENTSKNGFFRARYLNQDSLALRRALFNK